MNLVDQCTSFRRRTHTQKQYIVKEQNKKQRTVWNNKSRMAYQDMFDENNYGDELREFLVEGNDEDDVVQYNKCMDDDMTSDTEKEVQQEDDSYHHGGLTTDQVSGNVIIVEICNL